MSLVLTTPVAMTWADEESSPSYKGLPTGFTEEGYAYIGSRSAIVTLEEWSDYLCPYCARHHNSATDQLLRDYVATGQVRVVFRDLPLVALHPSAALGHQAAWCAGQQNSADFWAMHDLLLENQSAWNRTSAPRNEIEAFAVELKLDLRALESCLDSQESHDRITSSVEQGRELGFNGTPSFRVLSSESDQEISFSGAKPADRFAEILDAVIAGAPPPSEPVAERPPLPYWANPDGLAPDPGKPGYTQAGDAYKGDPNAPLVVVEFLDYQCPSCRRHAVETQPAIDAQLIATGKVRWVVKHFPLRIHEHAALAAVASECAGEQGQFWTMNDRLLKEAGWLEGHTEQEIALLAETIGLNAVDFESCFNGRHGLQSVLDDLYDAQGIIEQAPRFVLLHGGQGTRTGALPVDQFLSLLRQRVEKMEAASPTDRS